MSRFLERELLYSKLWSFNSHLLSFKANGHEAIAYPMTAEPNDLMTAKLNDIKQCLRFTALRMHWVFIPLNWSFHPTLCQITQPVLIITR